MASSPAALPLISLRPLINAEQRWSCLLLDAAEPLDATAVIRIVNGYGLSGCLQELPCALVVDPAVFDPVVAAGQVSSQRLWLSLSADACGQPDFLSFKSRAEGAGFRLVSQSRPDATLPAGVTVLPQLAPLPGPPAVKQNAPNRGVLLKLMGLITADAETEEIEALIKRDANLSYQLLKLVNSVAFSPMRKIDHFSQAITLLGRRQLQRWLQLLLYARQPGSQSVSPLLPHAALRADLMEILARRLGWSRDAQERAFMAGMFSLLDRLFGQAIATVIEPLNLPDDVVAVLTRSDGDLAPLMAIVIASEAGATPALAATLQAVSLNHDDWAAVLAAAMRWAVSVSKEA